MAKAGTTLSSSTTNYQEVVSQIKMRMGKNKMAMVKAVRFYTFSNNMEDGEYYLHVTKVSDQDAILHANIQAIASRLMQDTQILASCVIITVVVAATEKQLVLPIVVKLEVPVPVTHDLSFVVSGVNKADAKIFGCEVEYDLVPITKDVELRDMKQTLN